MSEGYCIEVGDEIVGTVVRQDGEKYFRFHSSARLVDVIDGRLFAQPGAAEAAAHDLVTRLRRPSRRSRGRHA